MLVSVAFPLIIDPSLTIAGPFRHSSRPSRYIEKAFSGRLAAALAAKTANDARLHCPACSLPAIDYTDGDSAANTAGGNSPPWV